MALIHVEATRNDLANLITGNIDTGGVGNLVFMTSGDVTVSTLPLSATSFQPAVSGTINANAITDDTNAVGGVVALFKLEAGAGNEILRGTVTATSGGGDIELSSINIGAGSTVRMTSMDYSASL